MKITFKKFLNRMFILFLIIYLVIMINHIKELSLNLPIIIIFIVGFSLAIFAHSKRNYITIILLVIHMSIEWFEWSQVGFSATGGTLTNIIHILMDFVFLSHELSAHVKKYKFALLSFITIVLISIFSFSKLYLGDSLIIDKVVQYLNPFVIAGIIGCAASHLFYHLNIFGNHHHCESDLN